MRRCKEARIAAAACSFAVLGSMSSVGQVAVTHAVISSGGVATSDGSIIVLGQPIAGLACSAQGSPALCVHPGFVAVVAPPACPGDADGNNVVNFADITKVLENWGMPGPYGDADGNNSVNFADITKILEFWGVSCS